MLVAVGGEVERAADAEVDPAKSTRRGPPIADPIVEGATELSQATTSPKTQRVDVSVSAEIGRFPVIGRLGHGGMGVVYAAYDDQLDRRVAIKVLHRELDADPQEQQRLRREAQAMARLSHPNVVTVHEVGEAEGAVFVVMEFIQGESLNRWIRTEPGWRAVLEAFLEAGQGLGAAHELGMVHRDFKPANVMRTTTGRMKVVDFGLARSVASLVSSRPAGESSDTWSSVITRNGAVVGTPAYMAPEQHEGGDVDARSDIYSYCASLWFGLTRQLPFRAKHPQAILLAKREGPPPWPKDAPAIPRRTIQAIRKGLRVSPDERWQSMDELLAELRWTPWRRYRLLALGLGGCGALAAAGVGIDAWYSARAERCSGAQAKIAETWGDAQRDAARAAVLGTGRPYADTTWARTQRDLDAYAETWVEAHTEACEATTVRGEESAAVLDARMRCLHRALVQLDASVGTLVDADATVVDSAHELVQALPAVARCEGPEALAGDRLPPPAAESEAVQEARSLLAKAASERAAGRMTLADSMLAKAQRRLEGVSYGPVRAEQALETGRVREDQAEYSAAEASFAEALSLGLESDSADLAFEAALGLMRLVGETGKRMDEGLRYWPVVDGLAGHTDAQRARAEGMRGRILTAQGKYDDAEQAQRTGLKLLLESIGADNPHVAAARHNLAIALFRQGKYEDAEVEQRQALAVLIPMLGEQHPNVATTRHTLASTLQAQGRFAEARTEFTAALSSLEAVFGTGHTRVASVRNDFGLALQKHGELAQAEIEFRKALAAFEDTLGTRHPNVASARGNLAIVLSAQGKHAASERENRAVLDLFIEALGADHLHVATARNNLANELSAQGKFDQAEAEYRTALSLKVAALGGDHLEVVTARLRLASLLLEANRAADALPPARDARAQLAERTEAPAVQRAEAAFVLARALWDGSPSSHDRVRAKALSKEALELLDGVDAEAFEDVDAWRRSH